MSMSDERYEQAQTCRRCGGELEWVDCFQGCDDGQWDDHDDDPINSPPGTWVACDTCDGKGGWLECIDCPVAIREMREQQPIS